MGPLAVRNGVIPPMAENKWRKLGFIIPTTELTTPFITGRSCRGKAVGGGPWAMRDVGDR